MASESSTTHHDVREVDVLMRPRMNKDILLMQLILIVSTIAYSAQITYRSINGWDFMWDPYQTGLYQYYIDREAHTVYFSKIFPIPSAKDLPESVTLGSSILTPMGIEEEAQ